MVEVDVFDEIAKGPENNVRAVLRALCAGSSKVEKEAKSYFKQLQSFQSIPRVGEKRKATDDLVPVLCVQCRSVFSQDENTSKSCRYHDGLLEVDHDEDFWADHDEVTHGPINTDDMREDFPQGFRWDCCDELGDTKGCTRGRHEAVHGERGKYGSQSPAGEGKRKTSSQDEDTGSERDEEGSEDE